MVKFTEDMKKSGFENVPAGINILRVKSVKANKSQGKLKEYKVALVDSQGRQVFKTYTMNEKNQYFMQSMRSFYSLLKTGCGLTEDENDEIDPESAVGKLVIAKINHNEGNDGRVFANLGWVLGSATSFQDDISEHVAKDEAREEKNKTKATEKVTEVVEEDDDDPYA